MTRAECSRLVTLFQLKMRDSGEPPETTPHARYYKIYVSGGREDVAAGDSVPHDRYRSIRILRKYECEDVLRTYREVKDLWLGY